MSDVADRAQAQMEQLAALQQKYQAKPTWLVLNAVRFCDDCGEKIPEARIKAVPYCVRCVDCQELIEK